MGAFGKFDAYVVLNRSTGEPVEGHTSEAKAVQGARSCNEHEIRCGREPVYAVVAVWGLEEFRELLGSR